MIYKNRVTSSHSNDKRDSRDCDCALMTVGLLRDRGHMYTNAA